MPAYSNRYSQDQYFSVFSGAAEERTERSYLEDPQTFQWDEVHTLQYEGCESLDKVDVVVGNAALGIARSYGSKSGDGQTCDVRPDFCRRYIKSVFGVPVPLLQYSYSYSYPAYGQFLPEWMDWLLRFVDSGDIVSLESTTEREWRAFEAMFAIVLDAWE